MVVSDTSRGAEVGGASTALPPALRIEDIRKTYPGTRALKGVSLTVLPGEVRALVGENGSGKSTLVGILGGRVAADDGGRVQVFGEPLPQHQPGESRALGIAIIHQELLVVPQLTAVENVFLGDLPHRGPLVARERMHKEFAALADQLGIEIDPGALAGSLSVAQQTLLEIMRAVRLRVRLLLMDEPTVTLGVPEREKLYAIVERLRGEQVACVLISHDLDEVMRLADSVTVFRDGSLVRTAPKEQWSKTRLVAAMLGEESGGDEVAEGVQQAMITGAARRTAVGGRCPRPDGEPQLSVSAVRDGGKLDVEHLSVAAGEIVGIAGLVGSGRTSLLRAIAGASRGSVGEMRIDGRSVGWPRSVHRALEHGIALLPEDRKGQGLVLDLPVYDNVTLSDLRGIASRGLLSRVRSSRRATELLDDVEFRGRVAGPVRTLSGGNQQKVMVAKWVHRRPRILLIDEPTRGIDIGAKRDIMRVLEELAARGHGIVWVSSELEEVVAVSHRVVLMSRGRVLGELVDEDISVGHILEQLFEAPAHGATATGAANLLTTQTGGSARGN
jgi:rhamnose transport system ATP-binding protein